MSQETADLGWSERAAVQLDPAKPVVRLPSERLLDVYAHARECYPEECCGLLIGPPAGRITRGVRCTNVQSQRHARGESELDARHGFWIHEGELARALREADERGERILIVYHSHVDTAAYLSHTDRDGALGPDGQPLWPGAAQLVVSVCEGTVEQTALFQWVADGAESRFEGHPVAQESSS